MTDIIRIRSLLIAAGALTLVGVMSISGVAGAAEEVASAIRRYKEHEASTGYYEEYEVLPRRRRPFVEIPGVRRGIFPYSPGAARVRIRNHLADSHQGIKFYANLRCEDCHINETHDIHTTRANLTCRQCHGGEPIAGIEHYFSSMNPIRRHAYVCAKCHEGSSVSFASYIVHQPDPGSMGARKNFPALYYTYWFMLVLLIGTLAFFIPHSFLVGLRELLEKKRTKKNDGDDAH
ncbi:cytochrome c3 family protein [Desulfococcus multivorans]|uniref:Tetrahaem cytochrome domain-containing protein n=1 Tax=Desulfococcus multivorans DSM 2059 TaxID=1121405 RepID=S7TVS0_DESML|nr:cytochrome c3 family protein [Desulfococcus multivorans]AOY60364.1 uncharacterized protein related to multiheme cytochrome [Desulfococcus multivorans]AQV02465.1 hypothetical protein B2D07_17965 [Desulfococcus multivorans]EPR41147.1 hypothetical protein dsmv_2262 [Desulfococcus multivorans DSM 2059]SJZ59696.1 hypothetical protein SAMN02745446_01060 [Desulfococcus multivorans DSM 2059]